MRLSDMQCWRSPREPEDWMNTWDFPNEPQARSLCKCAKSANGMIICRISMQSSVQWAKLKFIIYHIWRCWHIIHNKDNISFKWGKTKQAFIRRDNSPGKRKTSDIGATFWTNHEMNSQWTAARKKNSLQAFVKPICSHPSSFLTPEDCWPSFECAYMCIYIYIYSRERERERERERICGTAVQAKYKQIANSK